ncbi:MAG: bifunctional diaminohydroxyphosphoribosylaminopyrimidine deaminase/5-amino-6-(5-phosphoribosylamino)uracil reductase RibD [Acidobacteriota bacterium]
MGLVKNDLKWMERALELAELAKGMASPNPTVGCVVAKGNVVLGEGAHLYEKFDHAEIVALKQASLMDRDVLGATAYVTLEPCSHHGRTGPCADALIMAGIERCVVATVDPNPAVRGKGLEKLRAAGVEVVLLEAESDVAERARALNDPFARFIQVHRPLVTLKAAVSVDGMIAPPPSARKRRAPFWLSGEAAREDVQLLRHAADVIVSGVGTVLADDPLMTDRSGLDRRRPLLRVVLDSNLRTPLDSELMASAAEDLMIVTSTTASRARETELRTFGAEVLRLPAVDRRLDLPALLEEFAERDLTSVLVEAGSAVNGAFLREDLVDKVVLYYAEAELGLDAVPFAEGLPSPYVVQERLVRAQRSVLPHGEAEDVRISGYLRDPWIGI